MKSIKLLLCLLLCSYEPYAQPSGIRNGELTDFSGSLFSLGSCGGIFNNPDLCNWARSHGTPSYNISANTIFMFSVNGIGEGVFGGFEFTQDDIYVVELGLSSFNNPNNSGSIIVQATTGLTQSALISCGDNEPTPSSSQTIGISNQSSFSTLTEVVFTFTPTQDFSQIWIFPNTEESTQVDVILDYVRIKKCGLGTKVFCDGVIPPNPTTTHVWEYILAGNTACTPNGSLVYVNPADQTRLFPSKAADLVNAFSAHPNSTGYLLVEPKSANCIIGVYGDGERDILCRLAGSAKPGKQNSEINNFHSPADSSLSNNNIHNGNILTSGIRIYPNPTTGSFNIEMLQMGNYTIRVINLIGSTVYEGKMTDEQKKSIQLDQNLPPGNYTIHISGDGLRHVEKITLTK